jgi:DNA repair protein RAD51
MTTEEIEESQGAEDGGVGGPGAPTPLSALEVS